MKNAALGEDEQPTEGQARGDDGEALAQGVPGPTVDFDQASSGKHGGKGDDAETDDPRDSDVSSGGTQ